MKTLTVHGSGRHLLARGRGGHDLLLARGSGWRDLLLALGRGSQADLVLGQSLLTKKHPYICNLIEVTIRLELLQQKHSLLPYLQDSEKPRAMPPHLQTPTDGCSFTPHRPLRFPCSRLTHIRNERRPVEICYSECSSSGEINKINSQQLV